MNYNCENFLTQYEIDKLTCKKTTWNYFGVHFCRRCRGTLKTYNLFRCQKCGDPFTSLDTLTYYCPLCKSHYKRKINHCVICKTKCPKGKKVYCSSQCFKKGNNIKQKEWRKRHVRKND